MGKTKLKFIDEKFCNLTVIKEIDGKKNIRTFLCKCKCGKVKNILGSNLIGGRSKSCGCLQKENASKASKTHGGAGTRLYNLYKGMKQRCTNQNLPSYKYYGGKGKLSVKNG